MQVGLLLEHDATALHTESTAAVRLGGFVGSEDGSFKDRFATRHMSCAAATCRVADEASGIDINRAVEHLQRAAQVAAAAVEGAVVDVQLAAVDDHFDAHLNPVQMDPGRAAAHVEHRLLRLRHEAPPASLRCLQRGAWLANEPDLAGSGGLVKRDGGAKLVRALPEAEYRRTARHGICERGRQVRVAHIRFAAAMCDVWRGHGWRRR